MNHTIYNRTEWQCLVGHFKKTGDVFLPFEQEPASYPCIVVSHSGYRIRVTPDTWTSLVYIYPSDFSNKSYFGENYIG